MKRIEVRIIRTRYFAYKLHTSQTESIQQETPFKKKEKKTNIFKKKEKRKMMTELAKLL